MMGMAVVKEPQRQELACEFGNDSFTRKPKLCRCAPCQKIRKLEAKIERMKGNRRKGKR